MTKVVATATPEEIIRQKKYPDNYSKDIQSILRKALFHPNGKGLTIMGSGGVRSQRYWSDIDGFEVVRVGSINTLEGKFKKIIRNLLDDKRVFIGDIKLGNIPEWRVVDENAYFVDGKLYGYDASRSREKLKGLLEKKIITKEVYNHGLRLLKDNPNILEWKDIIKDLRFNITRWRPKDILKGVLKVKSPSGKTIHYSLKDALEAKSLFKLDLFALMNDGVFQEFSLIYDVRLRGRRLNLFPVNVELKLREDMSYYANNGQWWKFLKRYSSLTQFMMRTNRGNKKENEEALVVLNELLNSDLGIIANVRGDIDALLSVIENEDAGLITLERAKEEVDGFTDRLGNVYSVNVYLKEEPELLADIRSILRAESDKPIIKTLNAMYDKLTEILNMGTKEKMNEVGLKVKKVLR